MCGDDIDLLNGKPTGSVRISFGYMSLKSDADAFLKFVMECFKDCQTRGSGESLERAVSIQMTNGLQEMNVSDNTALKKKARSRLSKICLYPVKSCAALKVLLLLKIFKRIFWVHAGSQMQLYRKLFFKKLLESLTRCFASINLE